ncbi:hypothetical protein CDAR_612951 [Caerostris darwini]|uniref:Uncharacterized protein n=1 Tax=Caerostris darwini TaxID=1538125 RepID=A0AAV4V125_9ARAC|nr:hypothetical protein CDAR_612951 [Caerostris darwini]
MVSKAIWAGCGIFRLFQNIPHLRGRKIRLQNRDSTLRRGGQTKRSESPALQQSEKYWTKLSKGILHLFPALPVISRTARLRLRVYSRWHVAGSSMLMSTGDKPEPLDGGPSGKRCEIAVRIISSTRSSKELKVSGGTWSTKNTSSGSKKWLMGPRTGSSGQAEMSPWSTGRARTVAGSETIEGSPMSDGTAASLFLLLCFREEGRA